MHQDKIERSMFLLSSCMLHVLNREDIVGTSLTHLFILAVYGVLYREQTLCDDATAIR